MTLTLINSISKALDIANTEIISGTDRNSLVCEEKWENSGDDGELHGRTLGTELVTWGEPEDWRPMYSANWLQRKYYDVSFIYNIIYIPQ